MLPPIRSPNNSQHLVEIGRNGSGKTQAGLFHLSRRNFVGAGAMPWVIVDTKGDEMIEAIGKNEAVKHIKLDHEFQKKASGLHILKVLPGQQDAAEGFFLKVHRRGRVGIFIDEGYIFGKSEGLDILLTQGRSLRIPLIILTQRPSWLSRFVFSEASFFQVFTLIDERDRDTVQRFIPKERADLDLRLPEYYSLWYDVGHDQVTTFSPVPPREEILKTFKDRLAVKKVFI